MAEPPCLPACISHKHLNKYISRLLEKKIKKFVGKEPNKFVTVKYWKQTSIVKG